MALVFLVRHLGAEIFTRGLESGVFRNDRSLRLVVNVTCVGWFLSSLFRFIVVVLARDNGRGLFIVDEFNRLLRVRRLFMRFLAVARANGLGFRVHASQGASRPFYRVSGLGQFARVRSMSFPAVARASYFRCRAADLQGNRRVASCFKVNRYSESSALGLVTRAKGGQAIESWCVARADNSRLCQAYAFLLWFLNWKLCVSLAGAL